MSWQRATIIRSEEAADDIRSIVVQPENWTPHKAGQHYELRMPGSEFMRKYSVVSSPSRIGELEFGVQLIPGGVLSPHLCAANVGSDIEISGPWGESFIWEPSRRGPLVLIGAGSGITPLLCIHDSYKEKDPDGTCIFVMSAKREEKIMHFERLRGSLHTRLTEREGRIDAQFLKKAAEDLSGDPSTLSYVCGPDDFIDAIVDYLIELGFPETGIRSERFI